jgi:C4-dicarboxylate-specific signal transduction histidine kinase
VLASTLLIELTIARRRSKQALVAPQSRESQSEFARVAGLSTMGELMGSIAHQVNQPLTAIVTDASACGRWLGADPPNVEEAKQAAARVANSGKRVGDVISRIRALAQNQPGRRDRVEVNEAIRDVVEWTRPEAHRGRVSVEMRLAPDAPTVLADRVQLQQVILNLVLNGIEATRAAADGPRDLVISSEREGPGFVRVSVRDSGIGFDPEDRERLFDPFYNTRRGGIGMGLAISRSIVEAHRGEIRAVANLPRGALFEFTLPAARVAEGQGKPDDADHRTS